jgi:hypothetical protein
MPSVSPSIRRGSSDQSGFVVDPSLEGHHYDHSVTHQVHPQGLQTLCPRPCIAQSAGDIDAGSGTGIPCVRTQELQQAHSQCGECCLVESISIALAPECVVSPGLEGQASMTDAQPLFVAGLLTVDKQTNK